MSSGWLGARRKSSRAWVMARFRTRHTKSESGLGWPSAPVIVSLVIVDPVFRPLPRGKFSFMVKAGLRSCKGFDERDEAGIGQSKGDLRGAALVTVRQVHPRPLPASSGAVVCLGELPSSITGTRLTIRSASVRACLRKRASVTAPAASASCNNSGTAATTARAADT